jgi:hypothetical protein
VRNLKGVSNMKLFLQGFILLLFFILILGIPTLIITLTPLAEVLRGLEIIKDSVTDFEIGVLFSIILMLVVIKNIGEIWM